MTDPFVHLHNHSSYSALDGAAKVPALVTGAKEDNAPAIGVSDHGNLHGLIDFYKECEKQEIGFVPGIEAYFADDRHDRSPIKRGESELDGSSKRYYHLTVFAENNDGYQNLLKLSSDAFLEGMFYKPRTDWSSLEKFSKGLIVTSGCLGGPVLQELLHDNMEEALAKAARLQDIFGKENFFIELMNHGLPEQAKTNPSLLDIAKKLDAPLVATNDCHYVHHGDHVAHDALLCVQTNSLISQPGTERFKFSSDQHYLKSAAEMRHLFRENEDACDNTLWIAERTNVTIDFDTLHLPVFPVPPEFNSADGYLQELVIQDLEKFYPDVTPEVAERVAYELTVIENLGLASYFLIVWDLVKFAAVNRIRVGPGRGSAGGSIVSYILGITKIDPIKYGLIFERFINPHRIALADIDLDFDTRYRDMMINYVKDKYGEDHVAQIITFTTIKGRSALRDATRVLGGSQALADELSKAMPPLVMGKDTPLWACMEETEKYADGYKAAEKLRGMYQSNPSAAEVIDVALGLEGLVRNDGIHAAAVVIGDRPLQELVPVQRRADSPITTQWSKDTIEDLGLLKMDFLGLRNLDVITDTEYLIGNGFNIDDVPVDDVKTFRLLQAGKTTGVFQLESAPMKKLLVRLRPTTIEDVAAVVALYRPGPMGENMHNDFADRKNGRQPVKFFHDDAAEILSETQGLAIYQEEIMEISVAFAGYTLSEADNLRKIMGKKLPDKMALERGKFVSGCTAKGYEEKFSNDLFNMISAFADYGFNKSHAVGYGLLSYQTAYLKANYPRQYMAALCGSVVDSLDKIAVFLHEAREMGLKVYTPDVNLSETFFSIADDGIVVGLSAVKGLGSEGAENIIHERFVNGPYTSLIDFVERVNPNIKVLDALTWAGALDSWGTRLGIVSVSDNILAQYRKNKKKLSLKGGENVSMFDTADFWNVDIPEREYAAKDKLDYERRVLGIYVSGHPLEYHKNQATGVSLADLQTADTKIEDVLVLVSKIEEKTTKAGQKMAIVQIEDQTGAIESPLFAKNWMKMRGQFGVGDMGIATFRLGSDNLGERSYVFQDFKRIQLRQEAPTTDFVNLYLPRGFGSDNEYMSKLKGILLSHPGKATVGIYVGKQTKTKLPYEFTVSKSDVLLDQVKDLFLAYKDR